MNRFVVLVALMTTTGAFAQSNTVPAELTLPQSINFALAQNPTILKAQQELRRTYGLIVEARSHMLPHLGVTGQYTQIDPNGIDRFPGIQPIEFDNQQRPWNVQVEVSQLLYAGGKATAGLRAAKLTDQIALLDFQRTVADIVLEVRKDFYRILLAKQETIVHEQAIKLLEEQLADARHRFEAGTVPRFDVLRAEVELANARPPLIRVQNDLRLAKEDLVRLLAIDTPEQQRGFTAINFTGELTFDPHPWDLAQALTNALAKRPELERAEKHTRLTSEDIKIAQAGSRPTVSAFGGYQVHDSLISDSISDTPDGWLAGVRASWDIFDGLQARGKVTQARAKHQQAELDVAEVRRAVELEVRRAYSDYIQALELLEAEKKTVEQADESVRLAGARFRAGTGTQLDVLSAQTALTQASSNEIQARYDYNVALANLERATGNTVHIQP